MRKVGRPDSSRTAPSSTRRSNRRRSPRPLLPAIFSEATIASSDSSLSTTRSAALALSFGATASSRSERRSSSAERSMARSAARACAASRLLARSGSVSMPVATELAADLRGRTLVPRAASAPSNGTACAHPAVAPAGRRRARLQGRAQSRGVRRSRRRRLSFPPSRQWRLAAEVRPSGRLRPRHNARDRGHPAPRRCSPRSAVSPPQVMKLGLGLALCRLAQTASVHDDDCLRFRSTPERRLQGTYAQLCRALSCRPRFPAFCVTRRSGMVALGEQMQVHVG